MVYYTLIIVLVVDPLQYDETEEVPADVMKAMGEQGAFGIQVSYRDMLC